MLSAVIVRMSLTSPKFIDELLLIFWGWDVSLTIINPSLRVTGHRVNYFDRFGSGRVAGQCDRPGLCSSEKVDLIIFIV